SRNLTADSVFINAGARPVNPPLPGLDTVPVLNSTTVMELDRVPDHLLVLGGGYVGMEFGQLFRRLGARVTVIQRAGKLLDREDADIADAVRQIMEEDGLEILLNSQAVRAAPAASGEIALTVTTPEGERTLIGSHLLAAAGRAPNTESLNLPAAGIEIDARGF